MLIVRTMSEVIDTKNTQMTVYKYQNKTVPMSEMRSEEKLAAMISLLNRAEKAGQKMNEAITDKRRAEKQIEIQDSRIVTFNTLMENLRHFLERDDDITVTDNMSVKELHDIRQKILENWKHRVTA